MTHTPQSDVREMEKFDEHIIHSMSSAVNASRPCFIPGEDWPLAGTHRGHAGLANLLQKASDTLETSYPEPPEFVAQGDRVLVVGFAKGRVIFTKRTFEDHWVFAITVRNGKLTNIREYIDTQALARASEMPASSRP
jgi:ketosteroid isomerase-like protein